MNKHLDSVRTFRNAFSLPQAAPGTEGHVSDMDIIMRQAWLMEAGSEALRALKKGDMADILTRLVGLAYCALGAIAMRGDDVIERPVSWRQDGTVISIMRLLSDQISRCASGKSEDYSAVYCVCAHLTNSFLNADFDKALRLFHASLMENSKTHGADADRDGISLRSNTPDLSECLFE